MKSSVPAVAAAVIALSTFAMSPLAIASATDRESVAIAHVQGSGSQSPMVGARVTVEGILTADLRGPGAIGAAYLQSREASGLEGASDAILVLDLPSSAVPGDLVRVTGMVQESSAETAIVVSTAHVLRGAVGSPAPTAFTGANPESFEGMLVAPESFLLTGDARAPEPALESDELAVVLDDGRADAAPASPYLVTDSVIEAGDVLVAPERGLVLSESQGGYRLEPVLPVTAASPIAYRATFALTSNRLGTAPMVGP